MFFPDYPPVKLPLWKRIWHRVLGLFGINPYAVKFKKLVAPNIRNPYPSHDIRKIVSESNMKDLSQDDRSIP